MKIIPMKSFPEKWGYTTAHHNSRILLDASTLDAFNHVAEAGPPRDLPALLAAVEIFLPIRETDLRTVLYRDGREGVLLGAGEDDPGGWLAFLIAVVLCSSLNRCTLPLGTRGILSTNTTPPASFL